MCGDVSGKRKKTTDVLLGVTQALGPVDLVQVVVAADNGLVVACNHVRVERIHIREVPVGGEAVDTAVEVKPSRIP